MRMLKFLGVVAVVLLVAGGLAVTASWAPDRPVASLKARWAAAPSQFVRIGGMDVHLRDEGPREDPLPIVLVHGTSASLHTWDGWVAALKDQRRVIRVDLPGFGLTLGYSVAYLSLLVLIPLAGLFWKTAGMGWQEFVDIIFSPRVLAAYKVSFGTALVRMCAACIPGMTSTLAGAERRQNG